MQASPYDFSTMPTKRMSAGAIFLDGDGNVLIVKPVYRPDWLIPGGTIEVHESPREACIREVKEELDLDVSCEKLLCVEYLSRDGQQTESVHFVFYGGVLNASEIQNIALPVEELGEYRFSSVEEARALLSLRLARRVPYCLQALREDVIMYLENGQRL